MKILFLTNVLPFRRRNGGEVCTARLVDHLCAIASRVLVVGRGDAPSQSPKPMEVRPLGDPAIEYSHMSLAHKVTSMAAAVASGQSWTAWRMSSGVLSKLRHAVGNERFDHVFVDHLQIYTWYRRLDLKIPAVLVSHNVESQVYGDLLQRTAGLSARWVLTREQRLLDRLDEIALRDIGVVACLTNQDRAHYLEVGRCSGLDATVEVLPGYFEGTFAAAQPPHARRLRGGPPLIGILGTWTWASNRLGVDWFLRDVLPLVDARCEVVIAGRGLDGVTLPPRVRYIGFVESPSNFYAGCDIIAIPSTAGGGVQEKTIEAIGAGIPLVATTKAARGIDPVPRHVRVVDTARAFAAACSESRAVDEARARADAIAWNDARRLAYGIALDRLIADSARRFAIPVDAASQRALARGATSPR